ncbi:hypothetical protein G7Y89_g13618 [Cudoniella acicularis]|uniref:Saponin hydrolase n=1 Tax=Cudoniella acicularis TaxID=354080 RepID=A0A8H4VVV6_9HELO|nr:hypothetical protein G7Y89_g13618 [Cudoniella acicularis]
MRFASTVTTALLAAAALTTTSLGLRRVPSSVDSLTVLYPPPQPEPIVVTELPLPPVTLSDQVGSCTPDINPHRTGCILRDSGLQSGNFLPDGKYVTAILSFAGAPAAPDPASIYTGLQLILVKVDGTTFPSGDPWKCVTCGVTAANQAGQNAAMDYPQAFRDGSRVMSGTNIIDCGSAQLASSSCTPANTYIYPIRWNNLADGSGPGGSIRELRIHPDNVHLGFSSISFTTDGKLTEYGYFSRISFNPSPSTGTPLTPRYDLTNVTRLFNPAGLQPITVQGDQISYNPDAISIGELRGFSGRGSEITYVGYPRESSNIDAFAADLTTGKIRRLTSNPEYVDPIDVSPDDKWMIIEDTRGTGRQMFMAGMRGIPPITDLVSTTASSSTRNNGRRRFFEPFLLDRYGDRGTYKGQKLTEAGDNSPGSINDPNWNALADPRWSPDGTRVVYHQEMVISPACGGPNPLPCPTSTASGGRIQRMMMANFTTRKPVQLPPVAPISDVVPWGVPYVPGSAIPTRPYPSQGVYTLKGKVTGSAKVNITENSSKTAILTVAVSYSGYSDDGLNFITGTESVTSTNLSPTLNHVDWYSRLTSTGQALSTKRTSPDGFHLNIDVLLNLFDANGTLTTTINGQVYKQPANGT